MGGMGGGGWNASGRRTVESTAALSVSALKLRGVLSPGSSSVWTWSRGDEAFASIRVYAEHDRVRLIYTVSTQGDPPRRIDEDVSLERRPCRFGGARAFFRCPRCGRSALNLHLRAGRFTCRICARLTYASRRERERDRHLRAGNKLRRRLAGEEGALNAMPSRPKGMWQRTYARIVGEITRREEVAMEELAGWILTLGGETRRRAARFW